jgi:hypothetical protein
MSLGDFNLDTKESKAITNPEGVGLGPGGSEIQHNMPSIPTFAVSVKEGAVLNSDVQKTFTGPFAGTAGGAGLATNAEDSHGFHTPTGNKIQINGEAGAETIELVHHTGATIMIDADGAIFIIPTGRKGFGLNAGQGDGVVSASNRVIIKGGSGITLETEGNLELNVGQHLFMDVGGDFVLNVDGATTFASDGTINFEATNDFIETIGGIKRSSIAGDVRTQVAGSTRFDSAGDIEMRTDANFKANAQDSMELLSKNSSSIEVDTGKMQILAADDINLASATGLYLSSKDNISLDATSTVSSRSNGNFVLSTKGTMFLDADVAMDLRGRSVSMSAVNGMNILSANLDVGSTGHMNLHSTGAVAITSKNNVDIRGDTAAALQSAAVCSVIGQTTYVDGTTAIQIRSNDIESKVAIVLGATSPNSPGSAIAAATPLAIEVSDIRNPPAIISPKKAEYPDANTIIDSMTSAREAPDFPGNAAKMNAEEMSRYDNEGGQPNPKAKARSTPNQGAGSPTTMGESIGTIPDSSNLQYDGSNNNQKGEKNTYPRPSSVSNSNDKLSRIVTVGMLPGLMRCGAENNGLSRQQIIENAAHLAYNVIDPILKQWGNRIKITDHLRIGNGGSRHYSGKAVDMASGSRNFAETAEVAKWARENVAFDRLFLEANHAGTVHMHIEAAPEGSAGARTVWTCADPHCNSRQDGLNLAFAEQGLKKMGFA